jgi:hypothetical protein
MFRLWKHNEEQLVVDDIKAIFWQSYIMNTGSMP